MQLRTHIFLRVALAILLPMTLLVFAATYYSEQRYRQEVEAGLNGSLNTIIAEIDRRLVYERETFRALVNAPVFEQYLPVMHDANEGRLHAEFFARTEQINGFLETFQQIVPSLHTLRILDSQANTLVKVRYGQRSPALFDGIESFPLAEEEIDDEEYLERLYTLPNNEIGVTLLTQSRLEQEEDGSLPMLDYIMPIARDGEFLGYVVVNILGDQIDRILDLAPRPNKGQLMIAEINPEDRDRNGVILYDDAAKLRFVDVKSQQRRLQDLFAGQLYDAVQEFPYGRIKTSQGQEEIYYIEYLPYPDLLVHWVVALRIDSQAISAPFDRFRIAIATFAFIGVLVSLWLAGITAGRIARPITRLAQTLKNYANGDNKARSRQTGSDEVQQLAESFNYMADTLDRAAADRDQAQHIMLQQAKLASIGQMAAGIGHELNNPLNNILTISKLLERDNKDKDPGLHQDIESLRDETLRASEIVKGVLNFARQVPPQFSCFSIREWLKNTVSLVQQQARSQHINLYIDCENDLNITGDRAQLQQVLINLLLNAIQASERGAKIIIETEVSDKKCVVSVKDEGDGIAEEDLEKVFDPFFTRKVVGEGNGLGLSISLGIMEQHGGSLDIVNNLDKGVTASMRLPIECCEVEHG
ncbi:sensor histidine kinase [Sulfuriflexus mobilis]|uniref:sensor histidine kinase n=1 Tax=Sulfuriflexus mobilis TaxID=1811807 RepID=UPI000F836884|nr:sensor histidine kinase [Sulfuriflexus mobilis]